MSAVRGMIGHARRGSWVAGSQIISSLSNFGAGVVLARALGPAEFGSFALAFAVWLGVVGLTRAALIQPYVVTTSPLRREGDVWVSATKGATTAVALLGVGVGGVVLVASGALSGGATGRTMAVLAIFLAPLLVQDLWRFVATSSGRHHHAAINDAVFAIVMAAALGGFHLFGALSAASAMGSWGMGGLAGAVVGRIQFRAGLARLGEARRWSASVARMGGWFTLSNLTYSAGTQAVLFVIGGALGSSSVGGLRSVQNLVAPAMLVAMAAELYVLPAAARRRGQPGGEAALLRLAAGYSAVLVGVVGLWSVGLLVSGPTAIRAVFGSEFGPYTDLILPVAVTTVLGVAGSGASMGLRATGAGSLLALAQLPSMVAKLALVAVLAPAAGLRAAAWGLAMGTAVHAVALWTVFIREGARPRPSASPASADPVRPSVVHAGAGR